MGTDAGKPFNDHGENAQELAMMVAIGMPPIEVLKTATANGADLTRLPDHGRIAQGKRADFLITDGDPTTDITRISDRRHHRTVVKNGALINQSLGLAE